MMRIYCLPLHGTCPDLIPVNCDPRYHRTKFQDYGHLTLRSQDNQREDELYPCNDECVESYGDQAYL